VSVKASNANSESYGEDLSAESFRLSLVGSLVLRFQRCFQLFNLSIVFCELHNVPLERACLPIASSVEEWCAGIPRQLHTFQIIYQVNGIEEDWTQSMKQNRC